MMFAVAGAIKQQIDRRRERDVLDVGVRTGLELIRDHAASRDRFERNRADESRGRRRHDGHDIVAALLQATRDLYGLIRANSARYS